MLNSLEQEILQYAQKYPTIEVCGLIIVVKGREVFFPCKNISDNPRDSFVICPRDYASAEDTGTITKIVHSHPYTSAHPSEADLVMIEKAPKVPWIICNPHTAQFTETSPSNFELPLVGRTFTMGVLDCYTIIQDFYRRELGITLPEYFRENLFWERGKQYYIDRYAEAGFVLLDGTHPPMKRGDVILMYLNTSVTPNHGAVYLGQNSFGSPQIVHHVQGRLSSIDVYGGFYTKSTFGVLRHKDLLV